MEQKQLDDMEDSFFGDELVEDDVPAKKAVEDDVTIEEAKKVPDIEEPKKAKKKSTKAKSAKESSKAKEETVSISPAKEEPHIDPWAEEGPDDSIFTEVSTWKAITGITIVLLILSVFSQGFQFSEEEHVPTTGELSLQEASQHVLNYVNTNLLQPPFVAQVDSSAETAGLYKVTLDVAGQMVDSYTTKDGKLFFPQGIDTTLDTTTPVELDTPEVPAEPVDVPEVSLDDVPEVEQPAEPVDIPEEVPAEPVEEVVDVPEVPVEPEPVVEPVTVNLAAKRWLFSPNSVTVTQGSPVTFVVTSSELDFTFAISDLGVEQEVSGEASVTFTPETAGTYEFSCGSCEAWRGMTGTLVVE